MNDARKKTIALVFFIFSSAAFGVADIVFFWSDSWYGASAVLNGIVGIVATVCWCTYDARLRCFPFSGNLRLLVWLVALIGVPLYLKRSRGWRGAAKVGFGVPVFAASVVAYYGGWYVAYWIAEKTDYFL